jgi:hypothetical protein
LACKCYLGRFCTGEWAVGVLGCVDVKTGEMRK